MFCIPLLKRKLHSFIQIDPFGVLFNNTSRIIVKRLRQDSPLWARREMNSEDEKWMEETYHIAQKAMDKGEVPVGCLIGTVNWIYLDCIVPDCMDLSY